MSTEIPRVGRNEACPCGSGKKYKKCHGSSTYSQVVADVSKVGPEWVTHHINALLGERSEDEEALAQCALFDDAERLEGAELNGKDRRERELLDNFKLGLAQSVVEPLEVTDVHRGYGIGFKGALTGRRFYVNSLEVAEKLEPMEWVVGRVVVFGKQAYLLDGWERVPFRRRKQLRAALLNAHTSPDSSPDASTESEHVEASWLKERGAWIVNTAREVVAS